MTAPIVQRHQVDGVLQRAIKVISGSFPHPNTSIRTAYIKTSKDPIGLSNGDDTEYVWAELIDVCPTYIIKVATNPPAWDSRNKRIAIITKSGSSISINNSPT